MLNRTKTYVCAVPAEKPKAQPEQKVEAPESPIAGKSDMAELKETINRQIAKVRVQFTALHLLQNQRNVQGMY